MGQPPPHYYTRFIVHNASKNAWQMINNMLPARISLLAVLVAIFSFLTSCTQTMNSDPLESERPLAAQIAAVRSEKADTIQVEMVPLSDDDLQAFAGIPNLRVLLLDHPEGQFSADGLSQLSRLTSLEHLRIRGVGFDDASLAQIARISGLRILNLPQATFGDEALVLLNRLPKLELLRFGSPNVSDAGMKTIAELPALKQLHLIEVPITDAGLADLRGMKQLQSLYLDGAKISDAGVDELFKMRPDLHVHFNQQHHDRDPHGHKHK